MTETFDTLTLKFPNAKKMQRRVDTIKRKINETVDYTCITGSSIEIIIEAPLHTRRFVRDVVKELSDIFQNATIWFSNSSDQIGTRKKFDPSLLKESLQKNKKRT